MDGFTDHEEMVLDTLAQAQIITPDLVASTIEQARDQLAVGLEGVMLSVVNPGSHGLEQAQLTIRANEDPEQAVIRFAGVQVDMTVDQLQQFFS